MTIQEFNRLYDKHVKLMRDTGKSEVFKNADLSGLTLRGVNFSGAEFGSAKFDNAEMEYCVLRDCSFEGASFDNTKLEDCSFSNSRFKRARFKTSFGNNNSFDYCTFHKCYFNTCILKNLSFRGSSFENSVITYSTFDNLDLSRVRFVGEVTKFIHCYMIGAKITGFRGIDNLSIRHSLMVKDQGPMGTHGLKFLDAKAFYMAIVHMAID